MNKLMPRSDLLVFVSCHASSLTGYRRELAHLEGMVTSFQPSNDWALDSLRLQTIHDDIAGLKTYVAIAEHCVARLEQTK